MELTAVAQLRRMVLEHLSRYTWNDVLVDRVYDILQEVREDTPRYRCCVYKERAVLKNRIDMALGQECKENIIEASKLTLHEPERKDLPLIDVLPAACDQCPIEAYHVTDICRHCIAHKCMNNCPRKAISLVQNRAFIDKTKCVECGRCKQVCPYGAIIEIHRPCVRACALGAVSIGEDRKAVINHEICVSCGACRNACPFGAIDERSNIVRVITAIKSGREVVALVAPSIVGQFGLKITMGQIYSALKKAGFADVVEVGLGADITSVKEAKEYIEKVPAQQNYMTSSCCPAFVKLVKTQAPQAAVKVSETDSPMVSAGRYVKAQRPKSVTVFIGPCIAKKNEAREHSDIIDYVLTFEEAMCMLEGKDIKIAEQPAGEYEREASRLGLGFPLTAGVTAAVKDTVAAMGGQVRQAHYAGGLDNCLQAVKDAEAGKLDCSYLEGMACPNGCLDGPGTVGDFRITKVALSKYATAAPNQQAVNTEHTK
ncbi:MAG: 4Fe-4S dicluster domain-containing protein [Phascolarctobacterium sp.]|uniref:4Fe-4S dicluster domain-containing protein n=1 Tax=Phascolarctobacterium sp. TaxID=2049039 RepID=UPI0026DDA366|nr:4Fe-4S dicluster domain-containing protein [Phascolarctobacterium sp.]MDO4920210.1 4Fe-4S dicluster domain-containing protein [Phascolarctobacterium sp.]